MHFALHLQATLHLPWLEGKSIPAAPHASGHPSILPSIHLPAPPSHPPAANSASPELLGHEGQWDRGFPRRATSAVLPASW